MVREAKKEINRIVGSSEKSADAFKGKEPRDGWMDCENCEDWMGFCEDFFAGSNGCCKVVNPQKIGEKILPIQTVCFKQFEIISDSHECCCKMSKKNYPP